MNAIMYEMKVEYCGWNGDSTALLLDWLCGGRAKLLQLTGQRRIRLLVGWCVNELLCPELLNHLLHEWALVVVETIHGCKGASGSSALGGRLGRSDSTCVCLLQESKAVGDRIITIIVEHTA